MRVALSLSPVLRTGDLWHTMVETGGAAVRRACPERSEGTADI
jgi:hypothetical protein